jgi:hypothetical protein
MPRSAYDLSCDAFLPSYYASLSLLQEQEKNRATRRLRSGAARMPRRIITSYFVFLFSRFSAVAFFA